MNPIRMADIDLVVVGPSGAVAADFVVDGGGVGGVQRCGTLVVGFAR